jgi:P27 family predicted phage terminase small subunit
VSRPRKPTGLKLVTGTARADRMSGAEPEPMLLNDLKAPAHLSARSVAVWDELAPMLRRLQVLTEADVISLEMLCDSVADYRYAREQRGDDFVTHSSKGSQMVSQWLVAQQMSSKRAEAFMSKFGMDPVSRSKVMVDPQIGLPFGDGPATGAARHFKAPK